MDTSNPVFITELEQRTSFTGAAFLDVKTSDNKKYRVFDPGAQDSATKAHQNHTSVVIAFIPGKPVPGKSYNYCDTAKNIFPANSDANTPAGHPFPTSTRPAPQGPDPKDAQIARAMALKAAVELCAGNRLNSVDDVIPTAEAFLGWLMNNPQNY